MGKGDRKQSKRVKINRRGRPPKVGKREPNGRVQRVKGESEAKAQATALSARCRHVGIKDTPENREAMKSVLLGCSGGRVIWSEVMGCGQSNHDEGMRLWGALKHAAKVRRNFDIAIGAPSRHPKISQLLVAPEPFETDGDDIHLADLRTDVEKYDQAVSQLMELEKWLGYVDKSAASELKRVVWDGQDVRRRSQLLRALDTIADRLSGKQLV